MTENILSSAVNAEKKRRFVTNISDRYSPSEVNQNASLEDGVYPAKIQKETVVLLRKDKRRGIGKEISLTKINEFGAPRNIRNGESLSLKETISHVSYADRLDINLKPTTSNHSLSSLNCDLKCQTGVPYV